MMNRRSAISAFVALTFVSCATYAPKPLEPAMTARSFEERSLDDGGLREYLSKNLTRAITALPYAEWDLSSLTLVAIYFHPDLDVARARWSVVKAGEAVAGASPNPSIGFTPEFKRVPDISPWILGYVLNIPIETAGKRGYRVAQARQLTVAARCEIALAAWQVRNNLRAALSSYRRVSRSLDVLHANESLQNDIAMMMERRVAVGEAPQSDAARARMTENEICLTIASAEKESAAARGKLASALGLPRIALNGARISMADSNSSTAAAIFSAADLREAALSNRADILALLAEYAASESALQLEIAKQYPDIVLGPGYAWDQGDKKWSLGFSMELPLFNQNQGPIAAALARREETAARFRALQARVIGDVDGAVEEYASARREVAAADALVASKQKYERSVEAQYKVGEMDRLDLLQARLESSVATLARLDALAKAEQSLGLVEDAAQRPIDGSQLPSATELVRRSQRTK